MHCAASFRRGSDRRAQPPGAGRSLEQTIGTEISMNRTPLMNHTTSSLQRRSLLTASYAHTWRKFAIASTFSVLSLTVFEGEATTMATPRNATAAAQLWPLGVVGNLGGIAVNIPKHFAENVEYDHDPALGEPRATGSRARTYQSKLRSFGFAVRFPDMAGLSSDELRKDKRTRSAYVTPWISVGLNTGEDFPGQGALDRLAGGALSRPDFAVAPGATYTMIPGMIDGLSAFALAGNDSTSGRPFRQHRNAEDIFVHRDASGKVDAFIRCSNRPHEAAPCKHRFTLEPIAGAIVYVQYRRGMLRQWAAIQTSVTHLIFSFRATTDEAGQPRLAPQSSTTSGQ